MRGLSLQKGVREVVISDMFAALNGLVGLVQLVRSRDDCPVEIKQALTANYRLDDALAAIAAAETIGIRAALNGDA